MGPNDRFKVTLYASDDSGDESDLPVTITFINNESTDLNPRRFDDYFVQQDEKSGNLNKEGAMKIGPRRGIRHTLEFKEVTSGEGFQFTHIQEGTVSTNLLPDRHPVSIDKYYYRDASGAYFDAEDDEFRVDEWPIPTIAVDGTTTAPGHEYLALTSSGVVEDARWHAIDRTKVIFELKETGSSGAITITYYLVPRKSATDTDTAIPASRPRSWSKSLTVNVITCNSPPDPIDRCKGPRP